MPNQDKPLQSPIRWSVREYIAPSLPRVAAVAHAGLVKYGEGNYKRVPWMDDIEHAMHHLTLAMLEMQGLPIPEDEQGDDHLAHACCRIMMAMRIETGDKPRTCP